jgi:hypothetical protein
VLAVQVVEVLAVTQEQTVQLTLAEEEVVETTQVQVKLVVLVALAL